MTDQKLVDELEKALTDEAYDGGLGAMSPEEFRELVRTLAVTAGKVVDHMRAPATNEKLIEEAAKAIRADVKRAALGVVEDDTHLDGITDRIARAALVVFEKAHTPTDDEREALVAILEAPLDEESRGRTFSEMLADVILVRFGFRRSEVPEPSAEGYAEFEDWEQEMFRHQPVLSMQDGSIAGCQCLDRVFVKGREDWGTHLASVITARLPEPLGEPSDAQVKAAMDAAMAFYTSAGADISAPDDVDEAAMRAALRAAAVTEQGEAENR